MRLRQFPDKPTYSELARDYNVVPLCMEVLADTETPVSLLRKFNHNGGPLFLLESVEGGERWGRYSFLGVSARADIRVFADHVEIRNPETGVEQIRHGGDPLGVLRKLMEGQHPAPVPGLPRFWGGLVGYIAYEAVSFFEKIPCGLPPEKPLAHFVLTDEVIIFDNVRNTMTAIVTTFPENGSRIEQCYEQARSRLENVIRLAQEPAPREEKSDLVVSFPLETTVSEEDFREQVRRTKAYIRSGDIIQAVISQPFRCPRVPDLWKLYRAQRYINPSPYLFFLHFDEMSLIGSSPETMVRLENGVATVRPIAGTRPRGNNEQTDRAMADELLKDEKERAEHLMLVDLGRNDLGRVAETGTVQVNELMVVERYSHVMHLVSNVTCDLRPGTDAWDLLAATFPAGTLSGAPKVRAMEIIAEMEETSRGPYGGAVGYVSFDGNMDLAITIRTACVDKDGLTVRAGAGIVADSDPEKERLETLKKAEALQRALQLLSQSGSDRPSDPEDNGGLVPGVEMERSN